MESVEAEIFRLEARLKTMLPDNYCDVYKTVEPVPMNSAGLIYREGRVAWDEIWGSFCDLAMAGGPAHRGRLLEPGTQKEIDVAPEAYSRVLEEICRGIHMVTGLHAEPSPVAGWVTVYCTSAAMADWLARAITMENVAAHYGGLILSLPAAPAFRIEKEVKNVVTAVAKTTHYWSDHTSEERKEAIALLLREMKSEGLLIQPALQAPWNAHVAEKKDLPTRLFALVGKQVELTPSTQEYPSWVGFECHSIPLSISVTRFLVVSNVLARREGTNVYVPWLAESDPNLPRLADGIARALRCANTPINL